MKSLSEFLATKGITLSINQYEFMADVIRVANARSGFRTARSGKTFVLKLIDEYFTEVLPNRNELK